MQFQVPQFIEVEDKVIGPFTFKQFIYLLGGAGMSYIIYQLIPSPFSYLLIVPVAGFSGALAYYKINERPFAQVVESWVKFNFSIKRYLWRKEAAPVKKEALEIEKMIGSAGAQKVTTPKLTAGKLKDIAWSLDIQENTK